MDRHTGQRSNNRWEAPQGKRDEDPPQDFVTVPSAHKNALVTVESAQQLLVTLLAPTQDNETTWANSFILGMIAALSTFSGSFTGREPSQTREALAQQLVSLANFLRVDAAEQHGDSESSGSRWMMQQINRPDASQAHREASSQLRRPQLATHTTLMTPRERDIIQLLFDGYAILDVSVKLHITEDTVRTHIRNAAKRLDVSGTASLIQKALDLNLIQERSRKRRNSGKLLTRIEG